MLPRRPALLRRPALDAPVPPPITLPVPRGWYCVAFADEVRPGRVLGRRLAGRDLVVFRGADGAVAALDAICPHLGAHLALGTVEDGTVRCPFHHLAFRPDGSCTTAKLRATTWPAVECSGLVLVWYGDGGPTFHVPELDRAGWTAWRHHRFAFRGHVQDVAENGVDVRHLAAVHGYRNLRQTAPLETDGPLLVARWAFERPSGLIGVGTVNAAFEIHQWGLGYAIVEVELDHGVRTRQLVLACPVEADRLHLRIAMSVHAVAEPGRISPSLRRMPGRWLAEGMAALAVHQYVRDVAQDVPIWETKAWLERPQLVAGDGPVGPYRRWARQFYDGVVE